MEELQIKLLQLRELNSRLLKIGESKHTETVYHIDNYKIKVIHQDAVLWNLHIYRLPEQQFIAEVYFPKNEGSAEPIIKTAAYDNLAPDQIEALIGDYQAVIKIINMIQGVPL